MIDRTRELLRDVRDRLAQALERVRAQGRPSWVSAGGLRDRLSEDRTSQILLRVVVPLLIGVGLLLPPFNLADRIFAFGYTDIPASGGTLADPDGTQLNFLPLGLISGIKAQFSSIPRPDFLAGQESEFAEAARSIPAQLEVKSPLYVMRVRGTPPQAMELSIPIPNDAEPYTTLDLYGWDGQNWQWLPHVLQVEADRLTSQLSFLPRAVAVMQTRPGPTAVGAELPDQGALPAEAADLLSELNAPGLFLVSDGVAGVRTVEGAARSLAGHYLSLPTLSNRDGGVVREDLTFNILVNPDLRSGHIQEIVAMAEQRSYPGVAIYYRDLDPSLRPAFTAFIQELGAALHSAGKILALRVELPVRGPDGGWDTGAYDWPLLGRAVDIFQLPAWPDPTSYAPRGAVEELLQFAVGQVDRYKIRLILSTYAQERVGDDWIPLSYEQALARWAETAQLAPPARVTRGQTLLLQLEPAEGATPLQYLEGARIYWFSYLAEDGEHTIYLENAESLAHKLSWVRTFNLGGVILEGLLVEGQDDDIWAILSSFDAEAMIQGAPETMVQPNRYAILWEVQNASDEAVVEQSVAPIENPSFSWAPSQTGEYRILYAISDDGGQTPLVNAGEIPLQVVAPRPVQPVTPAPAPAPAPAPRAVAGFFGYGIQIHPFQGGWVQSLPAVQGLGLGWVKFQVRWDWIEPSPGGRNWNAYGLEDAINAFSGAGIKILLSVVAAPEWSRSIKEEAGPPDDFNLYASFDGDLTAHFRDRIDAIEVMNETNLRREWHTGRPLSASEYVDLLCRAYAAIKGVDSSIIVVSGAPTPTGTNDGIIAIDDRRYLREMYATGRLRGCSDAIGVHPSGYANPPDVGWPAGDLPTQGYDDHPSFFFLNTIQDYYNIMRANGDGNKRLWATEWGWASIENITTTSFPGYEFSASNTEAEQADFIVKAFQIAKNSGYMGVMFLWNLNFAPVCGPGCEQGHYGIVRPDWSLRPAYYAIANMPK
ncbi:MAG: hypothetical protein HYZ68_07215 [Chloroflexi bacterium]|nr:hypothetical protein [Chloroflexota bacterium]